MSSVDALMAVKVLIIAGAGAAFVWWQLRDLAKARQQTEERENQRKPQNHPTDT